MKFKIDPCTSFTCFTCCSVWKTLLLMLWSDQCSFLDSATDGKNSLANKYYGVESCTESCKYESESNFIASTWIVILLYYAIRTWWLSETLRLPYLAWQGSLASSCNNLHISASINSVQSGIWEFSGTDGIAINHTLFI